MDNLSYTYLQGTNQLQKVKDNAPANTFSDFDGEENYTYNAIGQLGSVPNCTCGLQYKANIVKNKPFDLMKKLKTGGILIQYREA